jgi:hypothetical protein
LAVLPLESELVLVELPVPHALTARLSSAAAAAGTAMERLTGEPPLGC